MPDRRLHAAGFSLIELLMVIAVVGVLVGLVLPSSEPSVHEQLRAAAQILKTDLAYGRSLAVTNNSTYEFVFDTENNRYILEHSGSNPALDKLPDSPFREPDDPPDQHIVDLDELPHVGPTVRLVTVAAMGGSLVRVNDVEFGPLGETTRTGWTIIWLAAGQGSRTRYLWLMINPVTGLVDTETYTANGPPESLL